jgi:SAM-dependent methyltransferase
MTSKVFGEPYSSLYDSFYHDKDYEAECDLIEEAFRRYGDGPVRTILDLGCGTGSHAFSLARRGYQVTGVDRSPGMLAAARQKAASQPTGAADYLPTFLESDLRNLDLGKQFDAVLMMFAVLSYQLTNADVLAALATVRRHTRAGGLFIADIWYGPAVLAQRPGDRVKVISTPQGQIIRAATGSLDVYRHLCEVGYHLWRLENDRLVRETRESHQMRYFFPQELILFLNLEKLRLLNISAFKNLDQAPGEDTWNILVIAKFNAATKRSTFSGLNSG